MESIAVNLKQRYKNITEKTPSYKIVFSVIVLITLILEIFVFNFKWTNSLFDKPINISPAEASGTQIVLGNNQSLNFHGINKKIKYIRFDPGAGNKVNLTISAKDEANANGISAPQYTVLGNIRRSQYIRLNFSGEISDLRINIDEAEGANKTISTGNIVLNTKVPLLFSPIRFILLILILMTLYIIRPGSAVYKYKTDLKNGNQQFIAAALIVIQAASMLYMIHWNSSAINWHKSYEHHQQYYALTDSIRHGHFYIGEDNGPLASMENPYDKSERDRLGVNAKWDHAFYNGKYYVYFGVVPAVLMYLPYNIITGADLPNYTAVYILCILTMIGIMLLLWEIIKKWFKNTPFVIFMILSVIYGAISILGYAVYKPDFYLVPSAAGLMFGVFGLAFWLSAEKTDAKGNVKLIGSRLALGSSCIALTAGCRPQMTLAAVLGVMLFWDAAFKKRLLFSKDGIRSTLAVCLPFVIVAAALMWYNAARFGSPFDFGANYNLTTNDMTHRGWVWGRTGLGIFSYLLQPIKLDGVFPFLGDFSVKTTYQGLTLTEMMVGGIFWLFPILFFGIYGLSARKLFTDKRAYRLVYIPLCMTVAIAVIDAQMAGLLTRYFTDFVWLAMLSASVSIFALWDSVKDTKKMTRIILILSCVTIIFVFLRIFAHSEDSIMKANPLLYYNIQRLIAFWM